MINIPDPSRTRDTAILLNLKFSSKSSHFKIYKTSSIQNSQNILPFSLQIF